jgi:hypothetical protein
MNKINRTNLRILRIKQKKLEEEKIHVELLARIQLEQKIELTRLRRLNKQICIIYTIIGETIVIVAIVDPLLRAKHYRNPEKYLIVGSESYRNLILKTFCGKTGELSENTKIGLYDVSTVDGITFNVVDDKNETVPEFTSMNPDPSLAGKSFSNVVFDQFCYDPRQVNPKSDENTKQFHSILERIVERDNKLSQTDPTHHIPLRLI